MGSTKLSISVCVVLTLMFTAMAFPAHIHEPPLGFFTTDISPERWVQLNPEHRFKGRVGDALRFEQIEDVYVIRCFMSVRDAAQIEKTVEDAIPAESEFLSGAIPEKLWSAKEPALLTVVFTTRKGEVGLMNVFGRVTIVEMNSRYGAVVNPQRSEGAEAAAYFACLAFPSIARGLKPVLFLSFRHPFAPAFHSVAQGRLHSTRSCHSVAQGRL